jgi:hypothetical protein
MKKVVFKMPPALLAAARADLARLHEHAAERVGFVTAGCSRHQDGKLVLLAREYLPIEDADYIRNPKVGAMIGPDAMRKGLQRAYLSRSALFHVHTHGGRGTPTFSAVDLKDGSNFVPSFFNVVPSMPHGLIVLSNDSARGRVWLSAKEGPVNVNRFVSAGAPFARFGEVA